MFITKTISNLQQNVLTTLQSIYGGMLSRRVKSFVVSVN